jgi:large subunit ribosomal protein L35
VAKRKTHSGAKKRFGMTGTGKLTRGRAFMRHNLRRRPGDMKSKDHSVVMNDRDMPRILKQLLPYGL